MDEQLALGMRGHAGKVGTCLAAFAGVDVALGAFLLENLLPARSVTAPKDNGGQCLDHFLAIRVGQAASLGKQCPVRSAIVLSGWAASL